MDNAYSRLVGLLRLVLPLLALILLATLFLLARGPDPDRALPHATVDLEALLREQRVTAPTYDGMTEDGDLIAFSARSAQPSGADGTGAQATAPLLLLTAPDGTETRVIADDARIDPAADDLVLRGHVVVTGSDGWQLETEELLASRTHSRLIGPQPVIATMSQGRIAADAFTLTRAGGAGSEVLVFTGGVKLLYDPQSAAAQP